MQKTTLSVFVLLLFSQCSSDREKIAKIKVQIDEVHELGKKNNYERPRIKRNYKWNDSLKRSENSFQSGKTTN